MMMSMKRVSDEKKNERQKSREGRKLRVSRTRNTGLRLFPFKCRQQEWTSKRISDEGNLTRRSYQQEMRKLLGLRKKEQSAEKGVRRSLLERLLIYLCLWHPRETLSCREIIFVFQKKVEKTKQFMTVDDALVT